MRRFMHAAMATGLAAGLMSGCGEQGVEQEAHIVGFARGVDGQVVEDKWVLYKDQPTRPGGRVRNLRTSEEFLGCQEVNDTEFSWNLSDFECHGFGDGCEETETTHCKAVYDEKYSYERLEEVVAQECPAPLARLEVKPLSDVSDEACMAQARSPRRLRTISRFVIWVRSFNKNHDSSNPKSGPAYYEAQHDITAKQWQQVSRETKVRVTVVGNQIVKVALAA